MTSLHAIVTVAQRGRTWIALATLAIVLFSASLAANVAAPTQASHVATPHYAVSRTSSTVADVTPFWGCGAIVLPC